MNNLKRAHIATRRFVYAHRVAIAITLTAIVCFEINRVAMTEHDNFLKQHGLYEKFYTPSDIEV